MGRVEAITWTVTKSSSKSTIGNVTMNYVDVNGLEIDRTDLSGMELSKSLGDIVKISDWVENNGATRKVSGYT